MFYLYFYYIFCYSLTIIVNTTEQSFTLEFSV